VIVDVPGIPLRRRDGAILYALVDADDFVWLNTWRWGIYSKGYAGRYEADGRTRRYMHREILGLTRDDERVVDHVNGNTFDNRRANLRVCTQAENAQNQAGTTRGTSRHRGVSWDAQRGMWRASVFVNGKQIFGGYFAAELRAASAAIDLRTKHMPFETERTAA
jgi:hypothetical protein